MNKIIFQGKEWLIWSDTKGQTWRKNMQTGDMWSMDSKGDWTPYKSPEQAARRILDDLKKEAGIYESPFV